MKMKYIWQLLIHEKSFLPYTKSMAIPMLTVLATLGGLASVANYTLMFLLLSVVSNLYLFFVYKYLKNIYTVVLPWPSVLFLIVCVFKIT